MDSTGKGRAQGDEHKRGGARKEITVRGPMRQIVLSESSLSADQQPAAPDEVGSYGELMDLIDQIIEGADPEPPA